MNHEDDVLISQCPEAKSKEIIDTFQIKDICTDKGVTIMHSIILHEITIKEENVDGRTEKRLLLLLS